MWTFRTTFLWIKILVFDIFFEASAEQTAGRRAAHSALARALAAWRGAAHRDRRHAVQSQRRVAHRRAGKKAPSEVIEQLEPAVAHPCAGVIVDKDDLSGAADEMAAEEDGRYRGILRVPWLRSQQRRTRSSRFAPSRFAFG